VDGGYLYGALAPGHRNLYEAPLAAHHLMRAHGAAVQRYRGIGKHQIGIVVNLAPYDPATPAPADRAAAKRLAAYMDEQYLDPALRGRPSEAMAEIYGDAWVEFPAEDWALIRQPIDFVGVNYYTRYLVKDDPEQSPMRASHVPDPSVIHTLTNWGVYPDGLTRVLQWVQQRYGAIPLYVTENGAAFADPSPEGDRVEDPLRVAYLRDHLRALHDARAAGVDVRGYFAWSLLDNFEWSSGYAKTFGLLHVDRATQRRTIKASAEFYREVIRTRGALLGDQVPKAVGQG